MSARSPKLAVLGARIERLWELAVERTRAPRPRELAFLVAVLYAVFVYLPLRLTFGSAGSGGRAPAASQVRPPRVQESEVDPSGVLNVPPPPYASTPGPERSKRRNPFAYGIAPTPYPTPTLPPTPLPPPPTPPPPTPTPYAAPFTLIGLATQGMLNIAFLKGPDEVIVPVLEGDKITAKAADGQKMEHVIKKIGLGSVTIGPTAFEAEVVLKLATP